MQGLVLAIGVELCLIIGVAGLLWPQRLKPVYEVLMFPWYPTYRTVRLHSVGAIGISVMIFLMWFVRAHWQQASSATYKINLLVSIFGIFTTP
jgi:hypothetical protein